jgi:hypothetical protein
MSEAFIDKIAIDKFKEGYRVVQLLISPALDVVTPIYTKIELRCIGIIRFLRNNEQWIFEPWNLGTLWSRGTMQEIVTFMGSLSAPE